MSRILDWFLFRSSRFHLLIMTATNNGYRAGYRAGYEKAELDRIVTAAQEKV